VAGINTETQKDIDNLKQELYHGLQRKHISQDTLAQMLETDDRTVKKQPRQKRAPEALVPSQSSESAPKERIEEASPASSSTPIAEGSSSKKVKDWLPGNRREEKCN
jgi:hypothetical protein